MTGEGEQLFVGGCIPDFGGGVVAGGGDLRAVVVERDSGHGAGVTGEGEQLFVGGCVPDFGGGVVACGGDLGAVVVERDSGHGAGVTGEGEQFVAGFGVPQLGGPVFAGGGDPGAVAADRHPEYRAGVAGQVHHETAAAERGLRFDDRSFRPRCTRLGMSFGGNTEGECLVVRNECFLLARESLIDDVGSLVGPGDLSTCRCRLSSRRVR